MQNTAVATYAGNEVLIPGPVLGKMGSDFWFYVPDSGRLMIELDSALSLAGGVYGVRVMQSKDGIPDNAISFSLDGTVTTTTLSCNFEFGEGGWYRLEGVYCVTGPTTPLNTTVTSVRFGWNTGGTLAVPTARNAVATGYFPIAGLGAAEYNVAPSVYQHCRVLSSSLLVQNTTAVLNKAGTILAASMRLAGREPWSNLGNNEFFMNDIQPYLKYQDLCEKGLYCFTSYNMTSGEMIDVQPTPLGTLVGSTSWIPAFDLTAHDWYYFVDFSTPNHTQNFAVVYDYHLESTCDSMLFRTGVATMTISEMQQLATATCTICPFVENPIHWAAIGAAVHKLAGRVWNRVRPYANPLAHRAVDYLIPPMKQLAIRDKPANPYRR